MINFDRVRTMIQKEWAEMFKNRVVLFTVVLMPVLFTALPIIMLSVMGSSTTTSAASASDIPAQFARTCGNMNASDCMQVYLVNEFLLLYLIMPVMIPITIAAYSIVGEKATHSLEPLLATPITTEELLLGKGLAAVIPAVVATIGAFAIFLIVLPLTGASAGVRQYIAGPTWLLAILLVGPLMSIAAVNFAIFVSSRTTDPRVAEQVSAILILPVLLVLFSQIAGVITINVPSVLIASVVLIAADIALVMLGSRLFQRETILTRWK
ncbi:MAG: ABC transporter permease subunit [Anaerolineaceae bacterium]|jgi:ABC-2 type transport system permease protein